MIERCLIWYKRGGRVYTKAVDVLFLKGITPLYFKLKIELLLWSHNLSSVNKNRAVRDLGEADRFNKLFIGLRMQEYGRISFYPWKSYTKEDQKRETQK